MRLFDPRLLRLLTYLTRHQAWLTAEDVSAGLSVDGSRPSARTIHRWFRFLRETGGFIYYPYPRANVLGLQDILVRIREVRNPDVFGILPFASSFNAEVELGSDQRVVSQSYWVPGNEVEAFRDYWRAARDLGHITEFELLRSRNTHYLFSPFHELIAKDGWAEVRGPVDNTHFEALLKRDLRRTFAVRLGERYAKSPLIIPLVVEHIWTHYSSKHVWRAIREKGEDRIVQYGKGFLTKAVEKPGAALRLLQGQWSELLRNFDEVFLQPRVYLDWTSLRNAMFVSIVLAPGSTDRLVEAAMRASERSLITAVKPGVEFEERCHINCFAPNDQLLPLLEIVREYHRGLEPASVAIQDHKAQRELFRPSFCKLDWRLFDPAALEWAFDADAYAEKLKGLPG